MPEGDTLFRIAAALGPVLEGARVVALELPRSDRRCDHLVGRRVERVEARGKNLLIHFDEGTVLHTHLRMSGAWHLYREGERWKRSEATASAILAVPGYVAVCFRAPIVRLLRASAVRGDRLLGNLGPDLLADGFDAAEALRRLRALDDVPLGVAIMDQRVVAGIGNVYKSELLFRRKLDPFAPVRAYSDKELSAMLDLGRRLLQANVEPRDPSGAYRGPTAHYVHTRTTRTGFDRGRRPVSVYGREGRACYDCGAAVQMRRQGTMMRSTYFCPHCQPPRAPPAVARARGAGAVTSGRRRLGHGARGRRRAPRSRGARRRRPAPRSRTAWGLRGRSSGRFDRTIGLMRIPLLLLLVLASGCSQPMDEPVLPDAESAQGPPAGTPSAPSAAAPSEPPADDAAEIDARFVPLIAAAFRDYKAWGRVDDELRWAPWLCRLPMPGRARMSAAEDGGHARKLYSVFARHRDRYPFVQGPEPVAQPVGQTLVKESYHPELVEKGAAPELPGASPPETPHGPEDHFDPYLREGDRVYRASRLAGAYVVLKVAPETPGTDAGWVYGTVTPEGEVTSAGRVASCMGCHESAPHERVFGIAPSTTP